MGDVKVSLPPGCEGIQVGGRTYRGRAGTHTMVPEHHARLIAGAEGNGTAGILNGRFKVAVATQDGRWCEGCRFLANRWSRECPKCGQPTIPESEMAARPVADMPSGCMNIAL